MLAGAGHETAYAQIAADALGVNLEDVTVVGGDTDAIPFGIGTFASRSTVLAGNAIAGRRATVRGKIVRAAARILEAAEADLEVAEGRVFVRGSPGRAVPFASIVRASLPSFQAPAVVEPDFEATTYQGVPTVTYASAVHVAVVDVDPETGRVHLHATSWPTTAAA
jgi:carbon-monoxide dehydrogenase large subunit